MGTDLPRLLHPEPEPERKPEPTPRSSSSLPPLTNHTAYAQPPACTASPTSSLYSLPSVGSNVAAPRRPTLTPPPTSSFNSPALPASSHGISRVSASHRRTVSSSGAPSHPTLAPRPLSLQATTVSPSVAESRSDQAKRSAPIPPSGRKRPHETSISYILSSTPISPPAPRAATNVEIPARPRTPPLSVPFPLASGKPKESDPYRPACYTAPLSPAQTPKASTHSGSPAREKNVRFAPRSGSAHRMPPPASPSREPANTSDPAAVSVADSYEAGSSGDTATPRHSSTDSEDRDGSVRSVQSTGSNHPNQPPSTTEQARDFVCNHCGNMAYSQLEQLESITSDYGRNAARKDIPSLIRELAETRKQFTIMSESCPECSQARQERARLLSATPTRPNKRKSPSYTSNDAEEASSKTPRMSPEVTWDQVFSLLSSRPEPTHLSPSGETATSV